MCSWGVSGRSRFAALSLAALFAAAGEAPFADAHITASVDVDKRSVETLGPRKITFRAHIDADGDGGRYRVELRPYLFGLTAPQEGAYVYPYADAKIEGDAILNLRQAAIATPVCAHGWEIAVQRLDLTFPPNSSTDITAPYLRSRVLPWPGADYRIRLVALPLDAMGERDTTRPSIVAVAPRIRVRGPVGVRIITHVLPKPYASHRFRLGDAVTIRGRTTPILRRRVLVFRSRHGEHVTTIARLRTDSRGRFGPFRWRPRHTGFYSHWLAYRGPAHAHVRSDRSCPQPLRVRSR
jgi:hypothetical protein